MTDREDTRWVGLLGGYRVPYDPRPAIAKLESQGREGAFKELWNELHHQGDVDTASYAAVPELVRAYQRRAVPDWNVHALVATIELQRGVGRNPSLPSWLQHSYREALDRLAQLALEDLAMTDEPDVARCALSVVALAKNLREHARLLLDFDESEINDYINHMQRDDI